MGKSVNRNGASVDAKIVQNSTGELQIFNNSEFGRIRIVVHDGNPWFVARDVCAVLDISNVADAISDLDNDEKCVLQTIANSDSINNFNGLRSNARLVNESGLYTLIFKSRKREAKRFRKWVTSEVLPAIRKTGKYDASQAPMLPQDYASALRALADEVEKRELAEQKAIGLAKDKDVLKQVLGIHEDWMQVKACDWVTDIFDTYGKDNPVWSQLGKKAVAIAYALGDDVDKVLDPEFGSVNLYKKQTLDALHTFVLNNPDFLKLYRKRPANRRRRWRRS